MASALRSMHLLILSAFLIPSSLSLANESSGSVVEKWIHQLGSRSFQKREEAARQLRALGSKAIKPLTAAARTADQEVARSASKLLKEIVAEANIQQWVQQLGSRSFRKREAATRQLQAVGAQALKPLIKAVSHRDKEIAKRAFQLIQKLFTANNGNITGYPLLAELAGCKNPKVANWAFQFLAAQASREVTPAVQAMKQLIHGKNKILAAKAKVTLKPPVQVLEQRVQEMRALIRAAAQNRNRGQMQELYDEYRKLRNQLRQRLRED